MGVGFLLHLCVFFCSGTTGMSEGWYYELDDYCEKSHNYLGLERLPQFKTVPFTIASNVKQRCEVTLTARNNHKILVNATGALIGSDMCDFVSFYVDADTEPICDISNVAVFTIIRIVVNFPKKVNLGKIYLTSFYEIDDTCDLDDREACCYEKPKALVVDTLRLCDTNRCLKQFMFCDGWQDCMDATDEYRCEAWSWVLWVVVVGGVVVGVVVIGGVVVGVRKLRRPVEGDTSEHNPQNVLQALGDFI